MRKHFNFFVVLFAIILLMFVLVACGETDDNSSNNTDNNSQKVYTVTFHLGDELDDVVWNAADDIPLLTKDGYHIVGYYLDDVFTQEITEEKMRQMVASKNVDVYVKWEKDKCNHNKVVDAPVLPTCTEPGLTQGSHCDICGEIVEEQKAVPALGHSGGKATCTEQATCAVCGTKYGDPLGHDYQLHAEQQPTCTENGWYAYQTCKRDGCTYSTYREIPAKGHNPVEDAEVAPTCTEPGLMQGSHCGNCGITLIEQRVIPVLGHDPLSHEGKAATCTENGWKSYETCKREGCTYSTFEEILSPGHHEVIDQEVKSTCTKEGLTQGSHCDVCGTIIRAQTTIAATGHDFETDFTIDVGATCTTDGSRSRHCANCDSRIENMAIPALGHSGGEATCTESAKCERCGLNYGNPLGHLPIKIAGKEPTCIENGWTEGSRCNRCEVLLESPKRIDALGHAHGEWFVDKQPTCVEEGSRHNNCTRCGNLTTERIAIDKDAHRHGDWIVKTEPTCEKDGERYIQCQLCNKVLETEIINVLGHVNSDWIEDVAATCVKEGTKHIECERCQKVLETGTIAALGHKESDWIVDNDSTCSQFGDKHTACSVCGVTLKTAKIEKKPHAEIIDNAIEPTCVETGLTKGIHCGVCGEIIIKQQIVDALGHDEEEIGRIEPTCEEYGVEYATHCKRCDEYIFDEKDLIKPLGHVYVQHAAQAPTCEEVGWDAYEDCSRNGCEYSTRKEIPALGHIYEKEVSEQANTYEYSATCYRCAHNASLDLEYVLSDDGTYYVIKGIGTCNSKVLRIVSTYGNLPVREIVDRAFANADLLQAFVPDSVERMGYGVFSGCSNLDTLVLPFVGKNAGVTKDDSQQYPLGYIFGNEQYEGSYLAVQNYYFNSVSDLREEGFCIPESLKIVAVTGGSILTGAFENCKSIKELYFADMLVPEQYYTGEQNRNLVRISEALDVSFGTISYIAENSIAGCSSIEILGLPFLGKQLDEQDTYSSTVFDNALRYHPYGFAFGSTEYENAQSVKYYTGSGTGYIVKTKTYYIPAGLSLVGVQAGRIYSASMTISEDMSVSLYVGSDVTGFDKCAFYRNHAGLPIEPQIPWYLIVETTDTLAKIPNSSTDDVTYYNPITCKATIFNLLCGSELIMTKEEYGKYPSGAFSGQSQIQSITAPSSAAAGIVSVCGSSNILLTITGDEDILKGAFKDCTGLKEVYIQDGVTKIYEGAFDGCTGLTYIEIPSTMTKIGYFSGAPTANKNAFSNCVNLLVVCNKSSLNITVGSNTNGYIAYYAKEVVKDKSESKLTKEGDFLIRAEGNSKVLLGYIGNEPDIVIPDGITVIGSSAFANCTYLTSIKMPNSVVSIGDSAFSGCKNLTRIIIPQFVTSIGDSAFLNCTGLTTIDWNATACTYAGSYASSSKDFTIFKGCSKLATVNIGENVKSIGYYAFYGCANLTSIYYKGDIAGWCDISGLEHLMSSSKAPLLKSITLYINNNVLAGDLVIPEGVTGIANYAFYNCKKLTSITIPNTVIFIGHYAFSGCSGLNSITIGNGVTGIYDYAFYGCSGVTDITIPDKVTNIGESAFYGCSGLTSIIIPCRVTSIGDYAFGNCTGLETVNWKATACTTTGSSGYPIFRDCSSLTTVHIENGVTTIPSFAFKGCSGLTSITIPSSVTSIGEAAFRDCSGLTSVTIPSSVTSIGAYAFEGCSELASIQIPDSITSIGCAAFNHTAWYSSQPDGLVYAGKIAYNYKGTMPENTTIALEKGTLGISAFAFSNCSGLISIEIPDSVTSIGSFAFFGCSSLESITIPFVGAKANVTSKDKCQYPFGYIFGTSSYTGGVATRQVYCENGVSSASTIYYIPSSLKSVTVTGGNIFYGAFYNCSGLTSVTIGDGVTRLGEDAFYNCNGLTNITISDSVQSIGREAFMYCSSLTDVVIGNNVTIIDDNAFSGCTELTSVTISSNVKNIGDKAFYNCSKLKSIKFQGTVEQWNAITKGTSWNTSVPSDCQIECIDDTITIS